MEILLKISKTSSMTELLLRMYKTTIEILFKGFITQPRSTNYNYVIPVTFRLEGRDFMFKLGSRFGNFLSYSPS